MTRLIKLVRLAACLVAATMALQPQPAATEEVISRGVTLVNNSASPTFNEVISRAVTVVNGTPPTTFTEAISRAVTVVDGVPPVAFTEAISRAVTVVDGVPPVAFTEAISRAVTIVDSTPPMIFTEAISRAYTVCDVAGLGDLNRDGLVDGLDVAVFVNVMLGVDTNMLHTEASDFTCDGVADLSDLQPFVEALLAD